MIALCGCPPQQPSEAKDDIVLVGVVTDVAVCAAIEGVAAFPLEAWVNATIELEATIADGDPNIRWTADSGTFSAALEASTRYRCAKPGDHVLRLVIEEGTFCEEVAELEVTCSESPLCGNDELDEFEACDDGNAKPGDGCSPLCTFEVD